MKKLTALILAFAMMLSLAACAGGGPGKKSVATVDPLTKDDVITMTINSHASWPYQEDWKIWEYIADGANVTLVVNAIITDANTKYAVMFAAPDTLPDIVGFNYKPGTDTYVKQSALISLDDMSEYMPNYNAWLETLTDEEYTNNVKARKSFDGKIYYTPVIGREASQNLRAWMYRKDIFEKHNLKTPETYDELFEVCKKLKELYPESYPFSLRSRFNHIDSSGSSFKEYWAYNFYYDYNEGKWAYGPIEDTALEVIQFYKKMIDNKLTPQDFMTMNNATWEELVTTDRAFIFPDYQTRIDFFNSLARKQNPDFYLSAMVPPVANPEKGSANIAKNNIDPVGFTIANTKNEARIANAAKFLDWFYTDEALELVSWGKEGETYEMVNGKKQYITDATGTQANTLYGFSTYGTFTRMDPEAVAAFESKEIAEVRDMVLEHTLPYANPTIYLAYSDEEQKIFDTYGNGIGNYTEEMFMKFILGQEPLSKWDEFVETVKNDYDIDKLLEARESAYARVK